MSTYKRMYAEKVYQLAPTPIATEYRVIIAALYWHTTIQKTYFMIVSTDLMIIIIIEKSNEIYLCLATNLVKYALNLLTDLLANMMH